MEDTKGFMEMTRMSYKTFKVAAGVNQKKINNSKPNQNIRYPKYQTPNYQF